MQGCNLKGANLSWCNLERADLSGSRVDGAQLLGVRMLCASLEGASLRGCNFEDPAGSRANMEGNCFFNSFVYIFGLRRLMNIHLRCEHERRSP